MEDTSVSPISLFGIVLFLTMLNLIIMLQDFSSSIRYIVHLFPNILFYFWRVWTQNNTVHAQLPTEKLNRRIVDESTLLPREDKMEKTETNYSNSKLASVHYPCSTTTRKIVPQGDEEKLSIEEVKTTIEKLLGIFCDPGSYSDGPEERSSSNEIDVLFEEEPSLEEVKEAFHVFDENKDGFIDARELRKVLWTLGFTQASEAECKEMIRADDNRDERIDFFEFVRLLEKSFS